MSSQKISSARNALRASAIPPTINVLDHNILQHQGHTSAIEFTTQRLQSTKQFPVPSPIARVEELTRELGYLRHEIHFYRRCFEIFHRLREASYHVYQELFLVVYLAPPSREKLHEILQRLFRGLEESITCEVQAERSWMAFWGLGMDIESQGGMI
ncbi:hypothetical protein ACMFMG_002687 [Clarireedia jacksonii]